MCWNECRVKWTNELTDDWSRGCFLIYCFVVFVQDFQILNAPYSPRRVAYSCVLVGNATTWAPPDQVNNNNNGGGGGGGGGNGSVDGFVGRRDSWTNKSVGRSVGRSDASFIWLTGGRLLLMLDWIGGTRLGRSQTEWMFATITVNQRLN